MNRFAVTAALAIASSASACSSSTEPVFTDVNYARALWVANHPRTYSFELNVTGAMFGQPTYIHIDVANDVVVGATDPIMGPVANVTTTIDTIWARVLAARADNNLTDATFNAQGVPLRVDVGSFANDGGIRYSIRNVRRR